MKLSLYATILAYFLSLFSSSRLSFLEKITSILHTSINHLNQVQIYLLFLAKAHQLRPLIRQLTSFATVRPTGRSYPKGLCTLLRSSPVPAIPYTCSIWISAIKPICTIRNGSCERIDQYNVQTYQKMDRHGLQAFSCVSEVLSESYSLILTTNRLVSSFEFEHGAHHFNRDTSPDVLVKFVGGELRLHKNVLCSQTDYFNILITGPFAVSQFFSSAPVRLTIQNNKIKPAQLELFGDDRQALKSVLGLMYAEDRPKALSEHLLKMRHGAAAIEQIHIYKVLDKYCIEGLREAMVQCAVENLKLDFDFAGQNFGPYFTRILLLVDDALELEPFHEQIADAICEAYNKLGDDMHEDVDKLLIPNYPLTCCTIRKILRSQRTKKRLAREEQKELERQLLEKWT